MKELELLELELMFIQDNIKRVKEYKEEKSKDRWMPNNSAVMGELKHRCVALKQRLTLVGKLTTRELF